MSEPVGSLGDEAVRLLTAAEQWLHGARERVGGAVGDIASHQGPECQVCPVCQVLALLRTRNPEIWEHLSGAAVEFGLAVRAVIDAQEQAWARGADAPVERIDIS